MDELKKEVITISGIVSADYKSKTSDDTWTTFTVTDDKNRKFKFYKHKKLQEGETEKQVSKAFEAVQSGQVGALADMPQMTGVAFAEEDDEFTNKEGKLIKYKKRRVAWFFDKDQMDDTAQPEPQEMKPVPDTSEVVGDIPF